MSQNPLNFSQEELRDAVLQGAVSDGVTLDSLKMYQVMAEFAEGFEKLAGVHPAVSFFGSARTRKSHKHYRFARRTAKLLSASGFSVISGGGLGIMEAVNRGGQEGGSPSIGLNIVLPGREETPNEFQDISIIFHNFFVRKLMFVQYASAYVVMPGGLGTLDEVMECLVLMQTNKAHRIPVILAGKSFWKGLLGWLEDTLLAEKTISESDLDLFQVLDEPEEICDAIIDHYQNSVFRSPSRHRHIQI